MCLPSRRGGSTRRPPGACCTPSLRPPQAPCVWAEKRCLPGPARRSANWVGRLCRWKERCGGRWSGSRATDMFRVGIVAALEREVRPLVKPWSVSEREVDGRQVRFFEKDNVVLVCGGIGAEAARRAAEAVIAIYAPTIIYSVGFAGAREPTLKIGEVMRPRRVVNAGDGSSVNRDRGEGILVSFGSVASPEQKAKLRVSFGAQAVDMEAAAVGRAAEARGAGFAVIKVISDEFDFGFPSLERFVDSHGQFLEGRFG